MSKIPDFGKVILSVMNEISKDRFSKRPLPYLMLTSKSESVLRDLLAFRLHEKFQAKDYTVAREWSIGKKKKNCKKKNQGKRADIAVLTRISQAETDVFKRPKAIIEIKMVASPSKNSKGISKALDSLAKQLEVRRKDNKWPDTEYLSLLAVRTCPGMSDKKTRAFDEVILDRKYLLNSPSGLDSAVLELAGKKKTNVS